MLMPRHPDDLSKRAIEVLRQMLACKDDMDGELVAEGLQVWIGYERTSRSVLDQLLSVCFIRKDSEDGPCQRYTINQSGELWLQGVKDCYHDGAGKAHPTLFALMQANDQIRERAQ